MWGLLFMPGTGFALRASFFSVAVWWALFTIPLLRHVPEPPVVRTAVEGVSALRAGFGRLARTFRQIASYRQLLLFLVALAARGGFGMGDVKFGLLLGLFLGYRSWAAVLVGIFAAFAVGGVVSVVLLALRRADRKHAIPFGPAMVVGSAIAFAWADAIADWYLSL